MTALMTCRDIADKFGLTKRARSWRGDCPACSYAGTFSLREGKGGAVLLYCASCQDRDALVTAVGLPRREPDSAAAAEIEAARVRNREYALKLWRGSESVPGSIVATYLASRHIGHLATCPDLRFRPDCRHPEGRTLPAMIALIRDVAGEPMAIHRTYLRRDGTGKADVDEAKLSLGSFWGGAVRLAPIAAELAIGEGIETAAAAGLLAGLPAWAAISAGNLATGLDLPEEVRTVVIAVDRDPAGEEAARQAARRWRAEGRAVRMLVPVRPGTDAADLLRARETRNA